MSGGLATLLALLFFAPLAFVYGRRVAAGIAAESRRRGSSPWRVGLPKLVLPLLLLFAMLWRLAAHGTSSEPRVVATGWRSIDAVLAVVDAVGGIAAILFFLTIPFALGRIFGVVSAAIGLFVRENTATDLPESHPSANRSWGQMRRSFRERATMPEGFTVAIDGPAAAGKGTLAKRLSAHYGLPYLDTGLLYRAVGRKAAALGLDLDDPDAAGAVARALEPSALDDGSLRGREAGELASRVAVHPSVRSALEAFQRDFARQPEGAVLDGRDIGTVIAPDAAVKIFVTASPEVRARRRTDELGAKGRAPDYERILAEVKERDRRDAGRSVAPLKPAPDAHLLDTSEMDIDAAFLAACELIDGFLSRRG